MSWFISIVINLGRGILIMDGTTGLFILVNIMLLIFSFLSFRLFFHKLGSLQILLHGFFPLRVGGGAGGIPQFYLGKIPLCRI